MYFLNIYVKTNWDPFYFVSWEETPEWFIQLIRIGFLKVMLLFVRIGIKRCFLCVQNLLLSRTLSRGSCNDRDVSIRQTFLITYKIAHNFE